MAVNRHFPRGARGHDGSLMSNNGGQPTATTFRRACATWQIPRAFTRDNNPKSNADTERGFPTRPHDLYVPLIFSSSRELSADIGYS
jgi:transposase InsO family protein